MKNLPKMHGVSLWRHFYDREKTAEQLTESMIEWQEKWNWDFLKLNPAACYHVLDWGAKYEFFDNPMKEPALVHPAISEEKDFRNIGPLDVRKGALGNQLKVIENLRSHFGQRLPIVETVFSPMEIAHRLMTGRDALTRYRRSAPETLHRLLQTITSVFREFCLQCLKSGADGIFFATKWASSDLMTWREYEEFGKRYDLMILEELKKGDALLILHVCGARIYLEKMLDYPSDIFSYDFFAEGVPSTEKVVRATQKPVLGGIDPDRLQSNVDSVVEDCRRFAKQSQWIAGPSCVISPSTSDDVIAILKKQLWSVL